MGMYTGIRFKGTVKKQFRENFKDIALEGSWDKSEVYKFKEFGLTVSRASFIPCGVLCYMPDSWEKEPYDECSIGMPTDGFDTTYSENTGYWTFQCSLKNYDRTIEHFFYLIPFFIESIDHLEYYYEEWDWSEQYWLLDEEVVKLTDKFVCYRVDDF